MADKRSGLKRAEMRFQNETKGEAMTDKDKTLDEFIEKLLQQYHEPPDECYDAEELKPILMACVEKGKSLGYDEGYAKGCDEAKRILEEASSDEKQKAYAEAVRIQKERIAALEKENAELKDQRQYLTGQCTQSREENKRLRDILNNIRKDAEYVSNGEHNELLLDYCRSIAKQALAGDKL